VLDGAASGCGAVVRFQGPDWLGRWYVPEPVGGQMGSAPILFVSSNPGAGHRNEPFDPARHMSRHDSDVVRQLQSRRQIRKDRCLAS
jgi:hypothetical protein